MTEEQVAALAQHPKQIKAVKRAGQNSITLAIVFIVVLLAFAFGRSPLARTHGESGSRVRLEIISFLGVASGVYAFFFLLLNFRTILRLTPVKKVLALVAGLGLIAHSAIAVLHPLGSPANAVGEAVGAAGNWVMERAGAEDWVIGGKTFHINGTYMMKVPDGVQYTIEYPCEFGPSGPPKDHAAALQIALPLMEHAFQQGLYKRIHVTKVGGDEVALTRIGVVLFEKQGDVSRGYRVALDLDEINQRIEDAANPAGAATAP